MLAAAAARAAAFADGASDASWLTAAWGVRLAVITYGVWHDATLPVRYTDVDYDVFTDAARFVWEGASPYDRQTYRYPPTLAALLVPTVWWGVFGKVLFAAADVAVGWVLGWRCSRRAVGALWLFNPVVVNVSTRGNADALAVLPIAAALMLLEGYLKGSGRTPRALAASAACLGAAIHLRLFPAIFLPAAGVALLADARAASWTARVKAGVGYAAAAAGAAGVLTAAGYAAYGGAYLEHAYFYHHGRVDHRHNLSPHWLPAYLGAPVPHAFAIQALPLAAACLRYRASPGVAWFVLTAAFVALNKVCTVQYFTWYLSLAPAASASGLAVPRRWGAAAAAVWAGALAAWLAAAYALEFQGAAAHYAVWGASMGFVAANVGCIGVAVWWHDRRDGAGKRE